MYAFDTLRSRLEGEGIRVVIAADGETRTHERAGNAIEERVPAGGVAVALDRVSQTLGATMIGRARSAEDLAVADERGRVRIDGDLGEYILQRVEVSPEELDEYYYGYANQSMWPLFHTAFTKPDYRESWFEGYRDVNEKFARAIEENIAGPTLVWINDYQLALVPSLVQAGGDTTLSFFWHIPWPSWERFRMLPHADDLLRSLLHCDFIGFQTEEFARNFRQAAEELGCDVDEERKRVACGGHTTRIEALPIGVDPEAIREAARQAQIRPLRRGPEQSEGQSGSEIERLSERYDLIIGVDRMDYAKGLVERLSALDVFYSTYPEFRERAVYVGVLSPSRDQIPAYRDTDQEVRALAEEINRKYGTDTWHPLHMFYDGLDREEIARLYARADVCLVTSLADGMNLVAKEFVIAAACSPQPGMLVLSAFAGASEDLGPALSINPVDVDGVARAIHEALTMDAEEKRRAIDAMASQLERDNVYAWAEKFIDAALSLDRPRCQVVA